MADLLAKLKTCDRGLYLAGWRFTAEQNLNPTDPSPTQFYMAIQATILRGVRVRAMIYKVLGVSFPAPFRVWHFEDNRFFCEVLKNDAQEPILDGRISPKPMSAHHQKFVISESSKPERTFAYVGGIDVCLDRWDSPAHSSTCPHPVPGEPRQCDKIEFYAPLLATHPSMGPPLALKGLFNKFYPSQPGWHGVQARVRGPAMQQIWEVFKNRWNDPRPANTDPALGNCRLVKPITASAPALPPFLPGTSWVQVTQTLPCKGVFGPYPFAPRGEQTIEKAYRRAIERAESYIYIEDQYLWPSTLVKSLVDALKRDVHVVIVVARDYDLPLISAVHVQMRAQVISQLRAANPTHFKVFHLQQPGGGQIYVHAKTMIIDDMVAFIGSANLNHRSMTNDTELQLGILDSVAIDVPMSGNRVQASKFAHEYRCELWQEHLGATKAQVVDPIVAINTLWATAPGANRRVFPHQSPAPVVDIELLAELIVNLIIDLSVPPIPELPLLDPLLPKKALQKLVDAALRASSALLQKVIDWLADILNPQLTC
jgi:phosphatidylserine/phosphatidylglycerophosphate/cardiolipin synthase-like enzyme